MATHKSPGCGGEGAASGAPPPQKKGGQCRQHVMSTQNTIRPGVRDRQGGIPEVVPVDGAEDLCLRGHVDYARGCPNLQELQQLVRQRHGPEVVALQGTRPRVRSQQWRASQMNRQPTTTALKEGSVASPLIATLGSSKCGYNATEVWCRYAGQATVTMRFPCAIW
jgi:hypothetical protein